MNRKGHRAGTVFVLAILVVMTVGCGHNFYVSESDAAAYQANLRTASAANSLMSSFQGKLITLHFDSAVPRPHLASSNIRDVLAGIPNLFILDTLREISLDRLAQQLEQQSDAWIGEQLYLLQQTAGQGVKLQRLDHVSVEILSPPTLNYDTSKQAISFRGKVKLILSGTVQVPDLNQAFDITMTVDDYDLPGQLQFSNPYADAARVRILLSPHPGPITVVGAADQVNSGIGQFMSGQLASPLDAIGVLTYDNFGLADLRIVPSQPEAQLTAHYLSSPHVTEPAVDVVARQGDRKLYHAQKRLGTWQQFAPIPLSDPVASDPALVGSGAGRLELAAVSPLGQLLYAAWRAGAWHDMYRVSVPGHRFSNARPALVATAPSQVDIVLPGRDGHLYHARRVNGAWSPMEWVEAAEGIAQRPLRDPTAVLGGSLIAVFFVDARNRLFSVVYDTSSETWAAAREVPSQGVRFAPAAVSCGDGRVDVVYATANGGTHHQVLNFVPANKAVLPASDSDLNQTLTATPALTCSGFQQMELVGRASDNHLWHNHLVGTTSPQGVVDGRTIHAGWQGWNTIPNNFFGTTSLRQNANPGLALDSTRTGQVELLATSKGNGARPLYENVYDSQRFGRAPWTAVHWRGLQELNLAHVVGSPAMAVSDRHAQLAIAWSQIVGTPVATLESLIWRSPLDDNNLPRFSQVPSAEVMPGVDPVILSSGPGSIETFYVSPGGRLQDLRVLNGQMVPTELPALGTTIAAFSATAFGNGQIEVVGVATDRTLHHWRRINGQWSDPATVSGTVISAPILVHVGDGQLDLLAVGGDQRVYHWRFLSGAWTDYHQAPSDFNVSAIAFGASAASSWGDGTVDVVVVAADSGKMFHGRTIPLQLGMGFAEIKGTTFDTPSLVAFGPDNLLLLALGTDGFLYQNHARSSAGGNWTADDRRFGRDLSWTDFAPLTAARVFSSPVAHGGDDELTVVVSDMHARVYVNRCHNQTWTGFSALPGQPDGIRAAPRFRPAIEIH
jgi:hypothetical protein